jgi:hypothetical protein
MDPILGWNSDSEPESGDLSPVQGPDHPHMPVDPSRSPTRRSCAAGGASGGIIDPMGWLDSVLVGLVAAVGLIVALWAGFVWLVVHVMRPDDQR